MADVSDVATALEQAVESARVASAALWSIRRGWPEPAALKDALKANATLVTIFQRDGFSRNTTRYPNEEFALPTTAPDLIVTLAPGLATFSGTCSPDQIAGVQVGHLAWVVRCGAADTPATVAAALAALAGGSAQGASLALTGMIAARTARDGGTLRPTRQQEVGFAVIVWAPDAVTRDRTAGAIDAALSDMDFLTLADGSAGRLRGAGSHESDKAQNAGLLRRDLYYSVDYSTTIAAVRTPVLFPGAVLMPGSVSIGALAPQPCGDANAGLDRPFAVRRACRG